MKKKKQIGLILILLLAVIAVIGSIIYGKSREKLQQDEVTGIDTDAMEDDESVDSPDDTLEGTDTTETETDETTVETLSPEQPSLTAVVDRILENISLEDAVPADDMIENMDGDQLYLYSQTQDGTYSLYGFHSPEYGFNGLLLDYRINGESNWNYLHEEIPDLELDWSSYPHIDETPEGDVVLAYNWGHGTGVSVDRFFYLTAYETGTLSVEELPGEQVLDQMEQLVELRLNEENEEVEIDTKETNSERQLLAVLPYQDLVDTKTETITSVELLPDWLNFLTNPQMAIVGVGVTVEGYVQPVMVGKIAAQIQREQGAFVLRDVSTYVDDGYFDFQGEEQ